MLKLDEATAVLLGNTFNVAIFQQSWLIENAVFESQDFSGENFFTPVAVSVSNEELNFLVVQDRIQLVFRGEKGLNAIQEKLTKVLGRVTAVLPHTPVSACGFNFTYSIGFRDVQQFCAASKDMFLCNDNPLADVFNTEDARFGAYFSKDLEKYGGRLRLDIKPIRDGDNELLRLAFNVHKDIKSMNDVAPLIESWAAVNSEVESIAKTFAAKFE